jgi:hypothetical protein
LLNAESVSVLSDAAVNSPPDLEAPVIQKEKTMAVAPKTVVVLPLQAMQKQLDDLV